MNTTYNLKKHKKLLTDNGYLLIKSVVKKDLINKFKKTFFLMLDSYGGFKLENDFDSFDLVKTLKLLRKKDEKKIHALFRAVRLSSSFNNLFFNDSVQKVAASILNVDSSALIISEFQFRIDEPKDRLFTLDWHQDGSYYDQDKGGLNSIVINICVQKCSKDMGSPELIGGSHQKGQVSMKKFFTKESKTLQYNTNKKFIEKNSVSVVEPKVGDMIIYDMNLIHRSGFNISKKARFSAVSRAFNPLASTFRPFYFPKRLLV